MALMINCIIFAHADLGSGLKNALEGIMGKQEGFSVISNIGLGKEEMILTLQKEIEQITSSDGVVIFVDLLGSSCWHTAKRIFSATQANLSSKPVKQSRIAIITGVNLPMLVKFFSLRTSLSLNQLVPLIRQEGEKGIVTEN